MQAHVVVFSQSGAGAHNFRCNRKRRAGRKTDLDLRAGAALVIAADQPFAVLKDCFGRLHGVLRWKPTVGFTQAHGAAGQHGAHAQLANDVDLHVDGVLQTIRKQVVVIGRGGTAGQQQFGERDLAGERQTIRRQACPDRIERLQPGEQGLIDHGAPGSREGLIEVVVRVYQPWQHDVLTGIEGAVDRRRGRLPGVEHFDNHASLDHQPAGGFLIVGGVEGEGVLDPDTAGSHGRLLLS